VGQTASAECTGSKGGKNENGGDDDTPTSGRRLLSIDLGDTETDDDFVGDFSGSNMVLDAEYSSCGAIADCAVGQWASWGACSVSCGSGSHTRSRTNILPENGGEACPTENAETEVCDAGPCPTAAPTSAPTNAPTNAPTPAPTPDCPDTVSFLNTVTNNCRPCMDNCSAGRYRFGCGGADSGACLLCNSPIANAHHVSNGDHGDSSSCAWACNSGFTHHQGTCQCSPGTYMDSGSCQPWMTCGGYQYESTAGTSTTNVQCATKLCLCPHGTRDVQCPTHNSPKCVRCSGAYHLANYNRQCDANICSCIHGSVATGDQCSTHGATKCMICHAGYYKNGNSCLAHTTCDYSSEFEHLSGHGTSNRVCRPITVCRNDQYEIVAKTTTSDRQCGDSTALASEQGSPKGLILRSDDGTVEAVLSTQSDGSLAISADKCVVRSNFCGAHLSSACPVPSAAVVSSVKFGDSSKLQLHADGTLYFNLASGCVSLGSPAAADSAGVHILNGVSAETTIDAGAIGAAYAVVHNRASGVGSFKLARAVSSKKK
jgi:hypothetical protein